MNFLNGDIEVPFPTLPDKERAAIEAITGHSVESSYTGFTRNLLEAIKAA